MLDELIHTRGCRIFVRGRWLLMAVVLLLLTACTGGVTELESNGEEHKQDTEHVLNVRQEDDREKLQEDGTEDDDEADEISDEGLDEKRDEVLHEDLDEDLEEELFTFPASVELSFRPLEFQEMEPMSSRGSWEWMNTIPFGEIDGEPVSLEIYRDTDSEAYCSPRYAATGLLVYRGETYGIPDCLADRLFEGDADQQDSLVWLSWRSAEEDVDVLVHGAVALTANGPGRMAIILYDQLTERWLMFDDWGTPIIADLDDDGLSEFVLQFEGLHLSPPDVLIYRTHNGSWEQSVSVKLQAGAQPHDLASLKEIEGQWMIEMKVYQDSDGEEADSARYEYRDGTLIRLD